MAKTLIAFYSRRGQNYVDGSIRNLAKGNNEVIVEKIKALLPDADAHKGRYLENSIIIREKSITGCSAKTTTFALVK